ncbi:DUF6473 family protein [Mycolicibacterium boenickei]
MWQPRYDKRDYEVVDYQYWELSGSGMSFRGPEFDEHDDTPYVVCAGAAQTFGCLVSKPYPAILGERLNTRSVNLGLGSAIPALFDDAEVLKIINGATVLVLQVMAARQQGNSRLRPLGTDLVYDRHRRDQVPAHIGWQRILDEEHPKLGTYVNETRHNWIQDYQKLLAKIDVPVILFYFSARPKNEVPPRNPDNLLALFGQFPQLVDGSSIDEVARMCAGYAECTSTQNQGHLLRSRFTGAPVEIDNSILDPRLPGRWAQNWYYPSPQMHEDAAAALTTPIRDLAQRR